MARMTGFFSREISGEFEGKFGLAHKLRNILVLHPTVAAVVGIGLVLAALFVPIALLTLFGEILLNQAVILRKT